METKLENLRDEARRFEDMKLEPSDQIQTVQILALTAIAERLERIADHLSGAGDRVKVVKVNRS